MLTRRNLPSLPLGLALAGAFLLAACGGKEQPPGPGPGGMGAPAVTVFTVETESVPVTAELPGRTSPYLVAEVRPQVTGIIKERLFKEGSDVRAGQVLYRIDPATYQAAYDSAHANLARAEANLEVARLKATRYADLVKIEAVSAQANDDAQAAQKQAHAEVAAAKAVLDKARVDLGYTRVASPIAGRIGRSSVTPGALVTANQAAPLATVQQLHPIYVDLTQSSAKMLSLKRDLDSGKLQRSNGNAVKVQLVLEDGSLYGVEGKLAFSEVTVDEGTGSVTLRAVFPNPKGELLPGMYVRARLTQGVNRDAMLVPHAAVSRTPRGEAQVMVVNGENKVEARLVEAEQSIGDKWVVTGGLAAGERVIVEGLQKVKPGVPVQIQEAGAAPAAAPAPVAPAAPAAKK
ncbi:MAG: efflux RND transporter periplasmic adaptor subunit [Thiobacillus sp.]|jgi:membrane fusion protein (multidrug efflux system)|uniref:efflux RND transporter periplasmic adaptor subunit n=1 Tax=Thiobacillus sp. TaxID=924 RepID=UPI00289455E6|nr:efflux RND transporter periplasmic adaptor subunit [Thiobacillus sp.]MDT3707618.1 efflux RND transporter periplasmic adaptor subunit [Thiobacillus sp.]